MRWCLRHLFSQTHIYPHMHAYADSVATSLPLNYRKPFWKLRSDRRQTKQIEMNHDDALAEPNIQRRAWWLNTPDCRAAPARQVHPAPYICWPLPYVQKNIKIYASSWRSRGCVVAQASSDHPRWYGPHQGNVWLTFAVLNRRYPTQNSTFFRRACYCIGIILHLNLIDCVVSLLKKEGVLNSPENLQFWQIAQPSLYINKYVYTTHTRQQIEREWRIGDLGGFEYAEGRLFKIAGCVFCFTITYLSSLP